MSTAIRWFRIAAFAEAVSWAGLIVGMLVKYVIADNEIGVQIFGPIHGALFVAYVVAVTIAARSARWSTSTWLLGLVSAVPPFMTVLFERYAVRTGERTEAAATS